MARKKTTPLSWEQVQDANVMVMNGASSLTGGVQSNTHHQGQIENDVKGNPATLTFSHLNNGTEFVEFKMNAIGLFNPQLAQGQQTGRSVSAGKKNSRDGDSKIQATQLRDTSILDTQDTSYSNIAARGIKKDKEESYFDEDHIGDAEGEATTGFTPFLEHRKFKVLGSGSGVSSSMSGRGYGASVEGNFGVSTNESSSIELLKSGQNLAVLTSNHPTARLVHELVTSSGVNGHGNFTTASDVAKNGTVRDRSSVVGVDGKEVEAVGVEDDGPGFAHKTRAAAEGHYEKFELLKEFWLFEKLPVELRHMVWQYAARVPHAVQVETSRCQRIFKPRKHQVPAILQASTESRHVAGSFFKKMFRSRGLTSGFIYFNIDLDTLCMQVESAKRMAAVTEEQYAAREILADRKSVKHLEVQFSLCWDQSSMAQAMAELVCTGVYKAWPGLHSWKFPGLKTHGEVPYSMLSLKIKKPRDLEAGFSEVEAMTAKIRKAYDEECVRLGEVRTDLGLFFEYM